MPLSAGVRTGKRFHHCLSVPRKHDDLGKSAHAPKYPVQARLRRTVFAGMNGPRLMAVSYDPWLGPAAQPGA
jgi:hypothetical protein